MLYKRPRRHLVKCIISQSTGGSTGEDEEELSGTCLETKHNTHHNEFLDHELIEVSQCQLLFLTYIECSDDCTCSSTLEKV